MQKFPIGSDSDFDPLIEIWQNWDGHLSLGQRSVPEMGTVTIWETIRVGIQIQIRANVKLLHSTMYPSGLESESEFESESGNVNKPLGLVRTVHLHVNSVERRRGNGTSY